MSDDEDLAPTMKRTRLFYGSLEEKERERLASNTWSGRSAMKAGIDAGNINMSSGGCPVENVSRVVHQGEAVCLHSVTIVLRRNS